MDDKNKVAIPEYISDEYLEADETLREGINTLKELCEKYPESLECRIYDV